MKNKNTKAVAAGVGLLALCQGGYIYNQSGNIDKITEQMEVASTERGRILSDLEANKAQSDSLIGQNSELTKVILEDERKITILNAELKAAKLKFEKLQQSYNSLKAKSESIASKLNNSSNAIKNNNSVALANEKAKQKAALRIAKDSMERERLAELASKRVESERARLAILAAKKEEESRAKLEALAAQKSAAERLKIAKDLAEKARLEAIASKNSEIAKTTNEKQAAEKARLEILAAKKIEANREAAEKLANEKARVEAAMANKKEADRLVAEKAKADLFAAKKNELERVAAEKAKADEIASRRMEAERAKLAAVNAQKNDVEKAVNKEQLEKNRIEALIEKKRAEVAKARQAIADRNKADEDAIRNSQVLPTNTAAAATIKPAAQTAVAASSTKPVSKQSAEVVEKLTKIKVTGFNTSSYRYINEDTKEEEETDDSSEVGFFKVNFTVPQNFVVKASDRNYYIQVIDQRGNFVGETASEIVDGEKLVYNQRANVKYKNRAVKISEYVFLKGLKEGTYTVKLFDKNELVSKALVVLN